MRAFVLCLLLAVGLPARSGADNVGFVVIVNPQNPIMSVEREVLRNAFLKKEAVWGNGDTIRPIDLSAKYPARNRFIRVVLRKTPAQLKAYWSQQIFSGKGVPPPEGQTPADVISYVMANRGAVGYVPADVDVRDAKVIEVR